MTHSIHVWNVWKWRQPSLQVKRPVLFVEMHLWSSQIHSATSSCLLKTSWSRFTIAFGIFCQHFLKNMLLHSLWQVFPFRPLFLSRENSQLPSLHHSTSISCGFCRCFRQERAEVISGVSHTHLWHQALSQVGLFPYQKIVGEFNKHVVDGMSGGGIGSWSWRYMDECDIFSLYFYTYTFFNIKDTWTQDTTCTLIHYIFSSKYVFIFVCLNLDFKKNMFTEIHMSYLWILGNRCTLGWLQFPKFPDATVNRLPGP